MMTTLTTTERKRAVLIAGPTASGKSALALALARRLDGVVINADSMQVYREMRILTARPTAAEEDAAPHALYGHVSVTEPYSVARWQGEARDAIAAAEAAGRLPVIVGGTGLYFRALTEGLAAIPAIAEAVREGVRALQAAEGAAGLHAALSAEDAVMAARLRPSDTQRLARALEVVRATGRSLADWQGEPDGPPVVPLADCAAAVLMPPRDALRARIDRRFDMMVGDGALAEVRALMAARFDPALPALKALGVPDLMAHLAGAMPLPVAVERAKAASRQYAKRQATWFRNQMIAWPAIDVKQFDSVEAVTDNFLSTTGLTA